MKILYDLLCTQPSAGSKFHGGGEYGKTIFKKLIESNNNNNIEVFLDTSLFIDNWIKIIIDKNKIKVNNIRSTSELNILLEDGNYDVLYSALPINYPNIYIPSSTKYIGTIHGLRSIEMPYDIEITSLYSNSYKENLKNIFKCILMKSKTYKNIYENNKINGIKSIFDKLDIVITVSEHSKYSMINYFNNIDKNKIKVLYTPQKYVEDNSEKFDNKYGDYILLISANRWQKNSKRAIDALDKLYTQKKIKYNSVIIGKLPLKIQKRIVNKNKFIFIDYVDTNELEVLYKNAKLFIYPTLNEGFGMPPLEAMKYNTKVISSAITSTTEILSDSVLYFNPYDVNEIAIRILQSIDDNSEAKGINQYRKIALRQEKDLDKIVDIILYNNSNS